MAAMKGEDIDQDIKTFSNLFEKALKSSTVRSDQDDDTSELSFYKLDFKEKFSLHHFKLCEGQNCSLKEVRDILSHTVFRKHVLLAGNRFANKSSEDANNGSIDQDSFVSEEENRSLTEVSEENAEINGSMYQKEKKSESSHQDQPVVYLEERVYSGPICKSPVQFIGAREQLKLVEGILKEKIIDTSGLIALSLPDARYLASLYTQCLSSMCKQANGKCVNMVSEIPVLVLKCKNEIPQNFSWMTCNFELFQDDVDCIGVLSSTVITEKTSITDYVSSFNTYLKSNQRQGDHDVSVLYFSRYELIGSRIGVDDSAEDETASSLSAEFAWREPTDPLEAPSLSADAVVKLRVTAGDSRSPAKALFLELSKLDSIIDSINSGMLPEKTADTEIWFSGQVKNFIQEMSDWRYLAKDGNQKEDDGKELSSPLASIALEEFKRLDMDFTDKLWDFLRNVVNTDDLTTCLGHVLSVIVSGELQPPLSSTNQTQLAKHIRDYYLCQGPDAQKELQIALQKFTQNSKAALALVADIGIEKVKTDYVSYFINQELATFSQLQPLLDHMSTPSEGIAVLMKLHLCLELLLLGKTYLNLKHENLRLLLRSALSYYVTNEATYVTPTFAISIPAFSSSSSTVYEICSKQSPIIWKAGILSEDKSQGISTTSIFMLTETPPADEDTQLTGQMSFRKSVSSGSYKVTFARDNQVRVF